MVPIDAANAPIPTGAEALPGTVILDETGIMEEDGEQPPEDGQLPSDSDTDASTIVGPAADAPAAETLIGDGPAADVPAAETLIDDEEEGSAAVSIPFQRYPSRKWTP